jgi:hypothetical protein
LESEYVLFDRYLQKVSVETKVFRFNPTNQIKLPLFENPVLEYTPEISTNERYRKYLPRMSVPRGNSVVQKILLAKQKDIFQKLNLSKAVGKPEFTKRSIEVYGKPSKKLINEAYEILSRPIIKEIGDYIPSYKIVDELKAAFKDMGINGWRVDRKEMVSSASVDIRSKIFFIRKKEKMLQRYVERLKVHEIGVHVARYENGIHQPLKVFSTGFAGAIATEEGLAAYMEELAGLSSNAIQRQYAGRVVAVSLALRKRFYLYV